MPPYFWTTCYGLPLSFICAHIAAKKHFQLPRWLKEHLQHAESWLNSATEELSSRSIEELLSHFDSQCQHHSAPPGHQSKSATRSLIELVMSLKATCEMKEGILKEIIQDQDDLIGVDVMTGSPGDRKALRGWQTWAQPL